MRRISLGDITLMVCRPGGERNASWQRVGGEEGPVSAKEKNKALVRRLLEAYAKGDLAALEEMLAPHFVNHSLLPGQVPGREGYIQSAAEQHAGFSDIRYITTATTS
jgi:SnoaL-like domain